jgi:hypothetical protein
VTEFVLAHLGIALQERFDQQSFAILVRNIIAGSVFVKREHGLKKERL